MLLEDKKLQVSSLEGSLYALKTLMEFSLKLEDKKRGEMSPVMVVQILLEIFNGIPEVRAAIKKNWNRILREINAKMMVDSPKELNDEVDVE